jgi:signal-transduction protein with cAMP-binding, CBS, and nucleotidyltransferase domain
VLTAVERVLILKGADLLNDIGPRHLLRLAEVARELELWKGNTIYKEDDLADGLYMVVEGRVRLTTGEHVTSEVGPGEAFGTWALVDDTERGHRVECIEDGLALMLPRDEFYDVAAGDLTLLRGVVRALAKRLRTLVSERPKEARLEGEGVEKPEALDEAKTSPLALEKSTSSPAEVAPAATPGASLTAAALGQAKPESGAVAPAAEPEIVTGEMATPEPIVPVEPAVPVEPPKS